MKKSGAISAWVRQNVKKSSSQTSLDTKVFGVDLQKLMRRPNQPYNVPNVVYDALEFLEERKAYFEEGLFRISGSLQAINELKKEYDSGLPNPIAKAANSHTVAGLLKMFLRELPDALLLCKNYHKFLHAQVTGDKNVILPTFKHLIDDLPIENKIVLRVVTTFLLKLYQNSEKSKMDATNIGIVFGSNFLRSEGTQSPQEILEDTKTMIEVMTTFLHNFDYFFPPSEQWTLPPREEPPLAPSEAFTPRDTFTPREAFTPREDFGGDFSDSPSGSVKKVPASFDADSDADPGRSKSASKQRFAERFTNMVKAVTSRNNSPSPFQKANGNFSSGKESGSSTPERSRIKHLISHSVAAILFHKSKSNVEEMKRSSESESTPPPVRKTHSSNHVFDSDEHFINTAPVLSSHTSPEKAYSKPLASTHTGIPGRRSKSAPRPRPSFQWRNSPAESGVEEEFERVEANQEIHLYSEPKELRDADIEKEFENARVPLSHSAPNAFHNHHLPFRKSTEITSADIVMQSPVVDLPVIHAPGTIVVDTAPVSESPLKIAIKNLEQSRKQASRPESLHSMDVLQLMEEKEDIKRELKQFDVEFQKRHHRMPEREDKEPLRFLYKRYKELKILLEKHQNENQINNMFKIHKETIDSPTKMDLKLSSKDFEEEPPKMTKKSSSHVLSPPEPMETESPALGDAQERREKEILHRNLKNEKRQLQVFLHEYQNTFFEKYGKKVTTREDRMPVHQQYERYKQLKIQLEKIESELQSV